MEAKPRFELTQKNVQLLKELIQLDIDASLAYGQAIDGVDVDAEDVRAQLSIMRDDHERHITELSQVLIEHGHQPPEYKRDLKGFVIEGMTAIRSRLGTGQALRAMRQNEVRRTCRISAPSRRVICRAMSSTSSSVGARTSVVT